ncbi:MAG: NAD-dependent succinate-semialdehyde dehydrogenase [Gammaproteobacteria bacterium]|nr:NAD-dependent succinate-semialdehyde dehydrogenase [Gammaproteobacteria bacterium]
MKAFETVNPANGETLERYPLADESGIEATLGRAAAAQLDWAARPLEERLNGLSRLADLFEQKQDSLAELMTREMGKPIAQARSEAAKCARAFRYYVAEAPRLLADEAIATDAAHSAVLYQPLGVIFAIMPWNFPFWQVARFAAPSLAAGNAGLLKHAPNTTGCGLAFAELVREAGMPEGVFQSIVIDTDQAARVIADRRIAAVTLTGSERAGRAVAATAGEHLKKCVLELGGSDPFVVLADADLDKAVETGVTARFQNNGQSCIAAKRFIVEAPVYDDFCARIRARTAALKMGDPGDEANDLGPMARDDLRDALERQVNASLKEGAQRLDDAGRPQGPGFFYRPDVLTGVAPGMPAAEEELFGPVAAVMRAADEANALKLANATPYGLGGSVWTLDPERGERFARKLASGSAFVNGMVKSDPRLPFGGIKQSGYGRELSAAGLREFLNIKTLWIAAD